MITPIDGMVIRESTSFKPGVYHLPKGIQIAGDGITVNGNGATLVGSERTRRGVTIAEQRDVTIKHLRLHEYHHGIYAERCKNLTIFDCRIASTAEIAPNSVFLDIWLPVGNAYGGGILLHEVENSTVETCDLQHQMVGLLSYKCRKLTVKHNQANYCSAFGFHLHGTTDSRYEKNSADFCCRYHPRGERSGHMGADAAGFLIVAGSSRNVFRQNSARLGGDGFFLAGLNPRYEFAPCNDNVFERNDGSYSPNCAFEATFSQGNIFQDNIASYSNYGFWLGFSSRTTIEGSQIHYNRQAGIAVENGVGFRVYKNDFKGNGHGVLLWSKRVLEFEQILPENDTSHDWLIERNTFHTNGKAIRIAADQDHGTIPYHPPEGGTPHPHQHIIQENTITDNNISIELLNTKGTISRDNIMEET